jgi:hypothetical protein
LTATQETKNVALGMSIFSAILAIGQNFEIKEKVWELRQQKGYFWINF